jgi:hypothetical protein
MQKYIIKISVLYGENSKGFVWDHNSGFTVKTVIMYVLFIDVVKQRVENNYYIPDRKIRILSCILRECYYERLIKRLQTFSRAGASPPMLARIVAIVNLTQSEAHSMQTCMNR